MARKLDAFADDAALFEDYLRYVVEAGDEAATLIRALVAERDRLREAALRAERFIVNGVEFGFIRMPDHDVPDPAHEALPFIRAALGAPSHRSPLSSERLR
jgi:hypothetical protein